MGSTVTDPKIVRNFRRKVILVLVGQLSCGADDLVDQGCQLHRSRIKFTGFDLREVEKLVNKAEQVLPGPVNALQRLLRLFGAEPCGVADHHLG